MTRLQKKCLVASTCLHAFLALLLIFGSAFFVAKERPLTYPKLQFFPSRLVEGALAGGGGNPNIARTDDVQKGVPRPMPAPAPAPPAPAPKPQTKPAETKPEVSKVEPLKPAKPSKPKPVDLSQSKVPDKPAPKYNVDLTELKPVDRNPADKAKAKAEAEARERAAEARERAAEMAAQARQLALARQKLGEKLGSQVSTLRSGFESGTKVDVGGPGGEAFAGYGALVQAAYENAWRLLPDLNDDDFITLVRVTISRDGRVTRSEILRKSASTSMDRSVQKALDKVRIDGLPPFPPEIRDSERSFRIEFNLKTKKLLG